MTLVVGVWDRVSTEPKVHTCNITEPGVCLLAEGAVRAMYANTTFGPRSGQDQNQNHTDGQDLCPYIHATKFLNEQDCQDNLIPVGKTVSCVLYQELGVCGLSLGFHPTFAMLVILLSAIQLILFVVTLLGNWTPPVQRPKKPEPRRTAAESWI